MIKTTYIEDYVYESSNEDGHKVTVDMRDGDEKKGLNAPELLLSALSGCVVVDIVTILKKKRKDVRNIQIETDGVRKQTFPRGYTDIHLKYFLTSSDVNEEEFMKVAKLSIEKYCTVADTLNAKLTYSVEIIRP